MKNGFFGSLDDVEPRQQCFEITLTDFTINQEFEHGQD